MKKILVCPFVIILAAVFVNCREKNSDLREKIYQFLSSTKSKNLKEIPKPTDAPPTCPVHKIKHENGNKFEEIYKNIYVGPILSESQHRNYYQVLPYTYFYNELQSPTDGGLTYINQPKLYGENVQACESCQKIPKVGFHQSTTQNCAGTPLYQNQPLHYCICQNWQCKPNIKNCACLNNVQNLENYFHSLESVSQPHFSSQNYKNSHSHCQKQIDKRKCLSDPDTQYLQLSNKDRNLGCAKTNGIELLKTCANPNCNCQNCKCPICQCSSDSTLNRGKRELSFDTKSYSNPVSRCKKCPCSRTSKDKPDNCRNKRHVDDFGQSVNNFFKNLFPKQFKDFQKAVVHMRGTSNNPTYSVNTAPQKSSLLDQLEKMHRKNNPQFYKQPKFGSELFLYNDVPQISKYYKPTQTVQVKNSFPIIPSNKASQKFVSNNNLPYYKTSPVKNHYPVDPILELKYNILRKELEPRLAQNTPKSKQSNFVVRTNTKNKVDRAILLRKLKRLNGNLINQNFKEQATDFIKKCLVPNKFTPKKIKFGTRHGEYNQNDLRKKRTIILGSDELDLPTHYEIEVVSEEEEEPTDPILGSRNNNFYEEIQEDEPELYSYETPEEEQSVEQLQGYNDYYSAPELQQTNPLYQSAPVLQGKYPSLLPKRIYRPTLPTLVKPDVIIGKNIIKKAVQEELNNYQKKMEREQKLKELKERRKNPFGYGNNGIPQNPMFALFNAPVDFLKQFHNLNKKSINPVMTTLPNLVYTAKKYFRNFGKDFKNNCMNLASNIIGDFDNVNPSVIESIVSPKFQNRYKRGTHYLENCDKKFECKKTSQNDVPKVSACNTLQSDKEHKALEPEHAPVYKNSKQSKNVQLGRKQKVKNKLDTDIKSESMRPNKEILKFQHLPVSETNFSLVSKNLEKEYKNFEKLDTNHGKEIMEPNNKHLEVFKQQNSKETTNFREVASSNVRKKRYIIKVVDSDEVQSQVEQYLTQKLNFKPLFENRFANNKPVLQPSHTQQHENSEEYDYFLESSEEKPRKKKIQIKKMKPRVIIDNKGLAFMEYNGIKRPLLFSNKKKSTNFFKNNAISSEEKDGKIDMLIQRAKEHTNLVGNTQNSIVPHKVIKERITHLLNEIDNLVNSKLETYDQVCEDLIKIHQIKISIEEDWKRLLIDNKVDDIEGKIEILEKFNDLQNVKNEAVKHIAETLQKNNSEFVRKTLISVLAKLQRLQSLITNVVQDFETRFQMQTPFNTKKEIKFVDYLSDLKFITEKTRNDLVKNIGVKRNEEVQKDIDILNRLKKFLQVEEDTNKLEDTAKIIWEMMNACKMQKETVKEMNKKLLRNQNVKKEFKILFDLQNRFDEANDELQESLGGVIHLGKLENDVLKKDAKPQKKDIKNILAEFKKKQEEWVKKLKKGKENK